MSWDLMLAKYDLCLGQGLRACGSLHPALAGDTKTHMTWGLLPTHICVLCFAESLQFAVEWSGVAPSFQYILLVALHTNYLM